MALWFAALLGLVQGLTEFIPVSSSAHLRIAPALLGQPDPGAAFTAVLQLGTLVAVLAYFAKDLLRYPRAMVKDPKSLDGRMPWLLVVGTLPIVVLGLALKHVIENDARSLYIVAGTLVGLGALLIVIDHRTGVKGLARQLEELTWTDAGLIGLAQACALVPGVSRSGSTICAALLLGFGRREAARFSFLLSIPAVAGSGVLELKKAVHVLGSDAIPALAVGTGVAAVSGYLVIAWLMKWLGAHKMASFGWYRIAAGLAVLALVIGGRIPAL